MLISIYLAFRAGFLWPGTKGRSKIDRLSLRLRLFRSKRMGYCHGLAREPIILNRYMTCGRRSFIRDEPAPLQGPRYRPITRHDRTLTRDRDRSMTRNTSTQSIESAEDPYLQQIL
jgi:hypothetical protein